MGALSSVVRAGGPGIEATKGLRTSNPDRLVRYSMSNRDAVVGCLGCLTGDTSQRP